MKFLKSLSKEKLQHLVLVMIVSLGAVGGTCVFYVSNQFTELATNKEKFTKLKNQLEDAQKAVKEELVNTTLREEISAFNDDLEKRMIAGDSFSWVVREISLLAEEHPVQISSLGPGGVVNSSVKPQYQMYTARLEVAGTYDDLGKFVSAWENSFPTSSIRGMSMVVVDAGKARCRINLDTVMMVHPQPAKPKPTEPKAEPEKKSA